MPYPPAAGCPRSGCPSRGVTNNAITAFNVAATNPFRFSSEYADDALRLVYYNYGHYNWSDGRWCCRDIVGSENYVFVSNVYAAIDWLGLKCAGKVCLYSAVGRFEHPQAESPIAINNGIDRHTWLSIESCDTDEQAWVYDPINTYSFGPLKAMKKDKDFLNGVPGGFFDPSKYDENPHFRVVKKCWSADDKQLCCVKGKLGKYPAIFSKSNYCTTEALRVMNECCFTNVPDGIGEVVDKNYRKLGKFTNPVHLAVQLENDGGIDLRWAQMLRARNIEL